MSTKYMKVRKLRHWREFFTIVALLLSAAPATAALYLDGVLQDAKVEVATHNSDAGAHPTLSGWDKILEDGNGAAPTTDGYIKYDRTTERLQVGDGATTSEFYLGPHTTVNDTPTNGETTVAASSNSVYDHINGNLHAWVVGATSVLTLNTPIVLDEATGNEYAQSLFYQTNKATSGDDTGQIISLRDTASPGNSYLFRAGVNTDGTVGTHTDVFSIKSNGDTLFPLSNDAATPTIAFGDGDTGLYEYQDDRIGISIGGATQFIFYGANFQSNLGSAMLNVSPSATIPSINALSSDANTGIGTAAADQLSLIAGGVEGIRISENTTVTIDIKGLVVDATQAVTCADSGGVGAQTATITPTSSYIEITNADADGCDITMGETGMAAGAKVDICVVSNAGTTVNFADTAGVSELAGAFAANIDDCLSLRYGNTTTWREVSRSAN